MDSTLLYQKWLDDMNGLTNFLEEDSLLQELFVKLEVLKDDLEKWLKNAYCNEIREEMIMKLTPEVLQVLGIKLHLFAKLMLLINQRQLMLAESHSEYIQMSVNIMPQEKLQMH